MYNLCRFQTENITTATWVFARPRTHTRMVSPVLLRLQLQCFLLISGPQLLLGLKTLKEVCQTQPAHVLCLLDKVCFNLLILWLRLNAFCLIEDFFRVFSYIIQYLSLLCQLTFLPRSAHTKSAFTFDIYIYKQEVFLYRRRPLSPQ